ncbi:hypothetical protein KAR91_66365 [Candidatus Pacearchaeota archaeon]|nr:hypothetical protein [Candidatus Pacearchaeota archaeon]
MTTGERDLIMLNQIKSDFEVVMQCLNVEGLQQMRVCFERIDGSHFLEWIDEALTVRAEKSSNGKITP